MTTKGRDVEDVGFLTALLRWLGDYPRRTWELHSDEGRFILMDRHAAQEAADSENAEYQDLADPARVTRGPWMRPSQVEALPEL